MHFKTAANYIRRSPYQAIAASLIMTLTFFIISIFLFISVLSIRMVNYFEGVPQLTVFFKDTAKIEQIMDLKKKLEGTGRVSSIRYVSQEEALKIYKNLNKEDDPLLNDLVTPEILPASLEIQSEKAEHLADLASTAKKVDFVESVNFQKDIIDTLISWTSAFRRIGLVLISILLAESVIVIVTIIGMKIIIRREEIEIMRLIGATNWFIRLPFIVEGAFYGFVGAFCGWIAAFTIYLYASPQIQFYFIKIPIFPIPMISLFLILLLQIIVASALGAFASFVAVLRYLK